MCALVSLLAAVILLWGLHSGRPHRRSVQRREPTHNTIRLVAEPALRYRCSYGTVCLYCYISALGTIGGKNSRMASKTQDAISDQGASPSGQPHVRVDGRAKVTGRAPYTTDIALPGMVHAVLAQSTIARGRATSIETQEAEGAPGVLAVITRLNAPRIAPCPVAISNKDPNGSAGEQWLPLQDDLVYHSGQHLAVVVA